MLHVKGQSLEVSFDSVCQPANGWAGILGVVPGQILDRKRLPETDECIGSEAASRFKLETHWQNVE